MKRTSNYALPSWEKSDFIKMEDFNGMTQALDTALKQQSDALQTKAASGDLAAVQQELAAARAENCFRKLAGPIVTAAANEAMTFDLSQLDMTRIAALIIVLRASGVGGTVDLYANSTNIGTACTNSRTSSAGMVWLVPAIGGVAAASRMASSGSSGGYNGSNMTDAVSWAELTSVSLGGVSYAGMTASLFALRL